MPTVQNRLLRALLPLALMSLIFGLSAQPNLGTGLGLIDLIGRKIAHAGVYATLTFLWWWALTPSRPNPATTHIAAPPHVEGDILHDYPAKCRPR